jgi:hypothetical protein
MKAPGEHCPTGSSFVRASLISALLVANAYPSGLNYEIYSGWSIVMAKGIRYRVLERALLARGCTSRPGKGDHVVWYCPCGGHIAVAVRARVVSPGVVQDIVTKLACLPEGWLS